MAFRELIKSGLEEAGMEIGEEQSADIEIFQRELLIYNEKVNLTAITSQEDFAIKHVVDSLLLFKYVDIPQKARVIDVGSGPGIPGILLKLYRKDITLTLVESVRKKTDFIEQFVQKMNLMNVAVVNERAETAAGDPAHRNSYDIAVARAVSSLRVLSELCIPFLKMKGLFIAMKGRQSEKEIAEAQRAIKTLGAEIEREWDYTLRGDMERKLVVIRKILATPEKYPRKPGVPAKNPL